MHSMIWIGNHAEKSLPISYLITFFDYLRILKKENAKNRVVDSFLACMKSDSRGSDP